jgi:acetylglutamate kinase
VRRQAREKLIRFHGGGPEIGELHDRLNIHFKKHEDIRVTPDESMPLVTMILRGLLNTRLVALFSHHGIPAIGISGVGAKLLQADLIAQGT